MDHTPRRPAAREPRWQCGVVSVLERGYETFEAVDAQMIAWLNAQLVSELTSSRGGSIGSGCYHLKGRGGIRRATLDLLALLKSGRYAYVIRSDAKGYYAHIRHHKLIGIMNDHGFSREVCHVTTQLCQRMKVRGGIYSECQQGIPLGCSASPALAAIYLSPLDHAIRQIPGVKYLRYMDDWIILCPTKWKMRRAVKVMHQSLQLLGLSTHPDKTFIGKVARGFDFLGLHFQHEVCRMSAVSRQRLRQKLEQKFSHAARLYEQGRLHSLKSIELYLTHWLRWAKGLGIATSTALDAILRSLNPLCSMSTDVMIPTFANSMKRWSNQQQIRNDHEYRSEEKVVATRLGWHGFNGIRCDKSGSSRPRV